MRNSVLFITKVFQQNICSKVTKPSSSEENKVNIHKIQTEPSKEEVEVPTSKQLPVLEEENPKSSLEQEIKESGIEFDEAELDGMDIFASMIEKVSSHFRKNSIQAS